MFYRNCGVAPAEGNTRKFGFINCIDVIEILKIDEN